MVSKLQETILCGTRRDAQLNPLYALLKKNFSTKFPAEMNSNNAKKYSKATACVVQKCQICDQDFQSFFLFRDHKWKEHGAQRGSAAQSADVAKNMGYSDQKSLKEELKTCKHFLVDIEMENGRHRVYNFVKDTLDPKYLLEKLWVVFDSLKYAAKLNAAFGLLLKNVEDGSCR